jgi:hypothetical protein
MRLLSALSRLASLALLAGALPCALPLQAQQFDLDRDREPIVSLDGLWRFHPGDSPTAPGPNGQHYLWADAGFDDSAWPLLKSDDSWSTQGYPNMSGYGWYRFTVKVPAGADASSLLLAPIVTSFEIYVDGKMVGKSGAMPPTLVPNTRFNHQLFPLTDAPSATARTLQVAIRVWHSPIWSGYVGGGPFEGGNIAGDRDYLAAEQFHEQLERNVRFVDYYAYSIAAGLLGLSILFLFFSRTTEREYLWFAVMLLAQSADAALNVSKEIYALPVIPIFDLIDATLSAINIFAAFCFFSRVLKSHAGILGHILLALVVISPFPAIFYWPGWASAPLSATLQILCLLPAALWIFVLLGRRATAGNIDARLLVLPTLLDLGFFVVDNAAIVLAQVGVAHWPRVLEVPLPLPPFTMRPSVLLHLFFLLAMIVFLLLRFTRARRREVRLAGEIEAARQIQQVLLPDAQDQCAGFTVDSVYQPAEQLGGDFFQQIADGQGGLTIVVGDVSGKGLPAAMLVSVLVGAIRAEAAHNADPATLLAALNDRMMGRSHGGFTTCLAAHIDASGLLTLSNAGHLAPYFNGEEVEVAGALPLGIRPRLTYEATTLQLKHGDRLTFVSDGVVEAQAKNGALFGFDRTRELSLQPAAQIAETARLFGQSDDITVVTVDYSGPQPAAKIA